MTWVTIGPPSAESRLNRIWAQDPALSPQTPGELDFIWRVASDGYFFVATGSRVEIKSSITEGLP